MKKIVWYIVYWYPMQSRFLSAPNFYTMNTREELDEALQIAKESNYDVVDYGCKEIDE